MYKTNILEFVSKEENNLLTSLHNFHADFEHLARVDGHYQAPPAHIDVPAADNHGRMLVGLYLFTHYHLYLSMVTLARCHLSDSLASTRKAIDATLTAYRLHVQPETLQEYLDEKGSYRFITRTIARAREKDDKLFPLAPPLLHLHGVCSQFGSHADISSFAHRVNVKPVDANKAIVEHLMFQYPEDPDEFRYYLASTMSAFVLMLQVFIDPLTKHIRAKVDGKDFDLAAWRDSTQKLAEGTEKVRKALAAVGVKQEVARKESQQGDKPK